MRPRTAMEHASGSTGVLILMLATYGQHVMTAGYVYEDAIWNATSSPAWGPRWIARTSWWLQAHVTPGPVSIHLVNLLLFGLLIALMWKFARQLGLSEVGAYALAIIMAIHPLFIESVAYGASRPELIAALGVVGACVASLRETWRWPLAICALLIGLGGKETALIALALVPLTWWAVGKLEGYVLPILALGAVVLAAVLVDLRAWANLGEAAGLHVTAYDWILSQSAAAYRLIGVTLSASGMTIDPDINQITQPFQLAALAALVTLAITAFCVRHSRPLVAFGLAWCLVSILPRLLVQTPRSDFDEHQFLVPSLGLFIAGLSAWDSATP